MLSLIISIVVAVVVGTAGGFAFGVVGAILPAVAAAIITYILLVRRVNNRVQTAMQGVQAALMQKNIDLGMQLLGAIKAQWARWVFLLGAQIDGQIGSIHFMKKEFEKARPHLEAAFIRMWDAKLMLAVLLSGQVTGKKTSTKADLAAVDALLEKVTRYSPKQGLLWSTWAYLHYNADDSKAALAILARGKEALGESDAVLTANLLALQNDKKMKMKGYGDVWYQFHLEVHPMLMQQQRGNVRFARR